MYRPSDVAGVELKRPPVLESWNARDHPDQLRLRKFLDEVEDAFALSDADGNLVLELHVGLPQSKPLTSGGDLDNYLFPIARRLGAQRFDAVFGTKRHGDSSTVSVTQARPVASPREADMVVRTTASATSRVWKEQVRDACALAVPVEPIPGSIGIDIEFRLSPARNWSTLWKPAIDSLGPLLGVPSPRRPFTPKDDRIVRLGLHRSLDASLGWDIVLSVWWTTAGDE
jgi:hypothetical protein